MKGSFLLKYRSLALALVLLATTAEYSAARGRSPDHFSHLSYTTPTNWKSSTVGKWLILSAPDLPAGQIGQIGISPGGETTRSLADEFSAFVTASQGSYTTVQTQAAKPASDPQGLPSLQQTVVLQDAAGAKLIRLYIGKKNGNRFEALSVTASPESAEKVVAAFKTFYTSLSYDGAPAAGAVPPVAGAPDAAAPKETGNETAVRSGAAALPVTAPTAGPVKISKHDKVIGPMAIAVGHDGTIHVAFTEQLGQGTENAVYYRSSSDGGQTWTEAKNLSEVMPTYMIGRVQIAVDASDRVYVIWRVAGEPNVQTQAVNSANESDNIVYRVLSGGSWNGTALNVNPPADHNNQYIGATSFFAGSDPSGKVHVAWVQSTDILHPDLMFLKMHQFAMGVGDVVQADLDGTSHSAPREIFMPKVTDQGPYKACEGVDIINGYFDSAGGAHFCGLTTSKGEPAGVNRIQIYENGTEKPGIVLPGPAYTLPSLPPTLLFDAQGRNHIVTLFPAGEHQGIRDYLIGSDAEPITIREASDVVGSVIGFQACQSPGGQMIALMEMNDTADRKAGDLYISTSNGKGWSKPVQVTNNSAKASSTNAVTGIRSSVSTVTNWFPGGAAATFDKQGHLVLIHERREISAFGINAVGVTLAGGDSAIPRLYFMRF